MLINMDQDARIKRGEVGSDTPATTRAHTATSQQIKVRACSIVCDEHPEWGTWGVMEDRGDWFEILGRSGSRVLFKSEADKFWSVTK